MLVNILKGYIKEYFDVWELIIKVKKKIFLNLFNSIIDKNEIYITQRHC